MQCAHAHSCVHEQFILWLAIITKHCSINQDSWISLKWHKEKFISLFLLAVAIKWEHLWTMLLWNISLTDIVNHNMYTYWLCGVWYRHGGQQWINPKTSVQSLTIRVTTALYSLPKCVGLSRNVGLTQRGWTSKTFRVWVCGREKGLLIQTHIKVNVFRVFSKLHATFNQTELWLKGWKRTSAPFISCSDI